MTNSLRSLRCGDCTCWQPGQPKASASLRITSLSMNGKPVDGGYRHTTTGRIIQGNAPEGSVILRQDSPPGSRAGRGGTPQTPPRQTGQRAGGRQQFGSPFSESSPLSNILESPPESTEYVILLEDITQIAFDARSRGWKYRTRTGSQGQLSRMQEV